MFSRRDAETQRSQTGATMNPFNPSVASLNLWEHDPRNGAIPPSVDGSAIMPGAGRKIRPDPGVLLAAMPVQGREARRKERKRPRKRWGGKRRQHSGSIPTSLPLLRGGSNPGSTGSPPRWKVRPREPAIWSGNGRASSGGEGETEIKCQQYGTDPIAFPPEGSAPVTKATGGVARLRPVGSRTPVRPGYRRG